ncbi:MAG: dual specificity protein phosphatase family protein, partial [Candidatus Margulisiibacteriota bacterium]
VVNLENTWSIYWRYKRLLRESGLECLPIPLNEQKTPTKAEWEEIKDAMNQPVYIHCKWGADRTGAIIARYLVEERGYTPEEAYKAVITGGTHAGPLGGLKQGKTYDNLVRFFWPHK